MENINLQQFSIHEHEQYINELRARTDNALHGSCDPPSYNIEMVDWNNSIRQLLHKQVTGLMASTNV